MARRGIVVSKQAVSLWAKEDRLPARRELQLQRIRPWWYEGEGNGVAQMKTPRTKKKPPANLRESQRKGGRGGKRKAKPEGPPFLPKTYGDPETQI